MSAAGQRPGLRRHRGRLPDRGGRRTGVTPALVTEIDLPGNPAGLAYDPATSRLFVALPAANEVVVIGPDLKLDGEIAIGSASSPGLRPDPRLAVRRREPRRRALPGAVVDRQRRRRSRSARPVPATGRVRPGVRPGAERALRGRDAARPGLDASRSARDGSLTAGVERRRRSQPRPANDDPACAGDPAGQQPAPGAARRPAPGQPVLDRQRRQRSRSERSISGVDRRLERGQRPEHRPDLRQRGGPRARSPS